MVDRRALIASLTAGLVTGLTACSVSERSDGAPKPLPTNSEVTKSPTPEPTQTSEYLIKKMGKDPINTVPKDKRRQIALTIDDGVRPDVVEGYCKIAKETGLRLTFFANGCYMSWKDNKKLLAPLMDSGQVVIGNHTYDHPWLTRISDGEIVSQMQKNEKHFKKLFGHSTEPFMRPPYGAHNSHVRSVLRSEGYRGIIMWEGNIGDDQDISSESLMTNAKTYFRPGQLVIGHANHPAVNKCYDKLVELIEERNLKSVTVADVFK